MLGESVLATSLAVQTATEDGGLTGEMITILLGGLLIVFSMWWLYFDRPMGGVLDSLRTAFVWGYGHLLVFASAAAVGAGLAMAIDRAAGHGDLGPRATGATVAIPVAVYLLSLWALHVPGAATWVQRLSLPVAAVVVLALALAGGSVLLVGVAVAGLVVVKVASRLRAVEPTATAPG